MAKKYIFTSKVWIPCESNIDARTGTVTWQAALLAESIATGQKAFITCETLEKTMQSNIRTLVSMSVGSYPKCFITSETTEKTQQAAILAYVNAIDL